MQLLKVFSIGNLSFC